jgi:nucleotide-binding universal stress UspA family protein
MERMRTAFNDSQLLREPSYTTQVITAENPVDVITEQSAAYDLLIIGTSKRDNWINVLRLSSKDAIAEKAACSVLRLTIR